MSDIKTYEEIGELILKSSVLKEKYGDKDFNLKKGKSDLEITLRQICKEKERAGDGLGTPTVSLTKKLNQIFNIGG